MTDGGAVSVAVVMDRPPLEGEGWYAYGSPMTVIVA